MPLLTYWKCHYCQRRILKVTYWLAKCHYCQRTILKVKGDTHVILAAEHFCKMPYAYAGSLSVELLKIHVEPFPRWQNATAYILAGKMPLRACIELRHRRWYLWMHFGKMPCEYAGSLSVEILNIHLEPFTRWQNANTYILACKWWNTPEQETLWIEASRRTNLLQTKVIHTERQNAYVSYSGWYREKKKLGVIV